MDLNNINILDLQTTYMKQDPTTVALCKALNPSFKELAEETKSCLILSRINELDSLALDELAWQLHIDWYDANVDIEIKRKVVKNSLIVHKYRGTPFAVEKVIEDYFGDGYVKEWFEYGGNPYMFKVVTSNSSVTSELSAQFIKVLNNVKNTRSHLEEIVITMFSEMQINVAGFVHIGERIELRQVM